MKHRSYNILLILLLFSMYSYYNSVYVITLWEENTVTQIPTEHHNLPYRFNLLLKAQIEENISQM